MAADEAEADVAAVIDALLGQVVVHTRDAAVAAVLDRLIDGVVALGDEHSPRAAAADDDTDGGLTEPSEPSEPSPAEVLLLRRRRLAVQALPPPLRRLFSAFDADADGALSLPEFDAYRQHIDWRVEPLRAFWPDICAACAGSDPATGITAEGFASLYVCSRGGAVLLGPGDVMLSSTENRRQAEVMAARGD